jgi:hypothetical protein
VLHARAGEVSANMEAPILHLCIFFVCEIAVMHAYECVSGNKSGACSRTWIAKMPACILIIIAIIAIIAIILLSIIQLIAIKCKKWTLISIIAIIDAYVQQFQL